MPAGALAARFRSRMRARAVHVVDTAHAASEALSIAAPPEAPADVGGQRKEDCESGRAGGLVGRERHAACGS